MQGNRPFVTGSAVAVLTMAEAAMGGILAPHGVLDWFTGSEWNLGVPPAFLAENERDAGYDGIGSRRTVLASPDAFLQDLAFPGEFSEGGSGSALTQLHVTSQSMTMSTSGDGAVIMNYAEPTASDISAWDGFWMRYTVTSGVAKVNAWLGNVEAAQPFMYFGSTTLGPGSGYLYFAFAPAWNVTSTLQLQGQANLSNVAGITLQFRSADGGPMAMSITGGIIPAPGAVALVGLAGLLGRRRRN